MKCIFNQVLKQNILEPEFALRIKFAHGHTRAPSLKYKRSLVDIS